MILFIYYFLGTCILDAKQVVVLVVVENVQDHALHEDVHVPEKDVLVHHVIVREEVEDIN